eukprot:1156043-Pelagomonas_calceolata.AAC.28
MLLAFKHFATSLQKHPSSHEENMLHSYTNQAQCRTRKVFILQTQEKHEGPLRKEIWGSSEHSWVHCWALSGCKCQFRGAKNAWNAIALKRNMQAFKEVWAEAEWGYNIAVRQACLHAWQHQDDISVWQMRVVVLPNKHAGLSRPV